MTSHRFTHSTAVPALAGLIVSLGALSACATDTDSAASSPASSVAPMPETATFLADMTSADSEPLTMAITVKGDRVVALATDGTDEGAYFFGEQRDGRMTLQSMYADDLEATYDGTSVAGELTMNEAGATPVRFTAAAVAAPAGIYTVEDGPARASWVVRPNTTMVGVMDNRAPGDHRVTDAIAAMNQETKDELRRDRLAQQMRQAPAMAMGTWATTMNGKNMSAVRVTGDMSF